MKFKIGAAFAFFLVVFINGEVCGQIAQNEENNSIASIATTNLANKTNIESVENVVDLYLKRPITLYFKNGWVLKGYLLPNNSENTDVIFVEINGEYKVIKFDDLIRFSMDNRIVDTIRGRIVTNDYKRRLDGITEGLGGNPNWQGYIIYYYGADVPRSYPAAKKRDVAAYIRMRRLDRSRITEIDGPDCGMTFTIELWIGDTIPTPQCPR